MSPRLRTISKTMERLSSRLTYLNDISRLFENAKDSPLRADSWLMQINNEIWERRNEM